MIVFCEIVIPPNLIFGYEYPPLALACLVSALKKHGFPSEIAQYRQDDDPEAWVEKVLALNPQAVGFSVFMGHRVAIALDLSRRIKRKRPDLPVLWGGVLPSLCPDQVLTDPSVDWVCVGPGETMIVELARALAGGQDLDAVPSLARRTDHGIRMNEPGVPRIEENASRPDWDSFSVDKFAFDGGGGQKVLAFISSRGCPNQCGFCYNTGFHGRNWRGSPIEQIQDEMLMLRERWGVNAFIFLDDLFLANRKRGLGLLRWMGGNGFSCYTLDLRADEIDAEVLDAVKAAHTTGILIGMESGTDRMLDLMKKGITRSDLLKAMAMLGKHPDILLWLSFIVGFPTETFEEMQQTIALAAEFARRPNTVVNVNAFTPLPGTALYAPSLKAGFVPPVQLEDWTKLSEVRRGSLDHWPGRLTAAQMVYLRRAANYIGAMYAPYPADTGLLRKGVRTAFLRLAEMRLRKGWMGVPVDLWAYQELRRLSQAIAKR